MFSRRKRNSRADLDDYTVEPMEPRVLLSADALGVDAGMLDHDAAGQADWDLKDADDWSRSLASHDIADTAPLTPVGDDTEELVFPVSWDLEDIIELWDFGADGLHFQLATDLIERFTVDLEQIGS